MYICIYICIYMYIYMYYIYIIYVYICNHEKRVDLWQLNGLDLSCVPNDMSSQRAMW